MAYRRLENESTASWLERLIELEAPIDIRADVRQILANEQSGKPFLCLAVSYECFRFHVCHHSSYPTNFQCYKPLQYFPIHSH